MNKNRIIFYVSKDSLQCFIGVTTSLGWLVNFYIKNISITNEIKILIIYCHYFSLIMTK